MYKLFSPWFLGAYTSYCFYRTPSINDSIIIIALATLCGFEFFFKSKLDFYAKSSVRNKNDEIDKLSEELQKISIQNRITDEKARNNYKSFNDVNQGKKIQF